MFSTYSDFINDKHNNRLAINLLQDGVVRSWNCRPSFDLVPTYVSAGADIVIKICSGVSCLYAVTASGRVVEWVPVLTQMPYCFKAVRPVIDLVLNGYTTGTSIKMVAGSGYILIAFGRTVAKLRRNEYASTVMYRTFEHEIEEISGGTSHGFVRTASELHSFGENRYQECGRTVSDLTVRDWYEVAFAQIRNIREIVCGECSTFIILNDGSVWACGQYHSTRDKVYVCVLFPKGEPVRDVIISLCFIFYITETGLCYYAQSSVAGTILHYFKSEITDPVQIQFLSGYFIERIYILFTVVVFQYDGGKLLMVHLVPDRTRTAIIDSAYESGALKPVRLDAFDDGCVCDISQVGDYLYLTTEAGQVYYCECGRGADGSQADMITFFDDNPAVVDRDGCCRVRSAGSDMGVSQC